MSNVLFLGMPSHGHVNPTLGLVSELTGRGETIIYFSSPQFREQIEKAGAVYKSYCADLDIFSPPGMDDGTKKDPFLAVIESADRLIADILYQTRGNSFDYLIYSAAFPFAKPMEQILQIPTVASLAIFAGLQDFFDAVNDDQPEVFPGMKELSAAYDETAARLTFEYGVTMPENAFGLLLNKADLNLIYTSDYFISDKDKAFFDSSFRFVGPPVFDRKGMLDFPVDLLKLNKVIYISLGTVFGNYKPEIYQLFFDAFRDSNVIVVMTAYRVDLSTLHAPENFILRNYVPQTEVLQYADAAITHAGMNSISDIIYSNTPFVAIPLGADQPALAARAEELGAAITLDVNQLTPEKIREAVFEVMSEPVYLANLKKISDSFRAAGGYPRAADEIFALKRKKEIAVGE